MHRCVDAPNSEKVLLFWVRVKTTHCFLLALIKRNTLAPMAIGPCEALRV